MAKISFKAKVENMSDGNGGIAWQYIRVPVLTRKHCDMAAFRSHPKYGMFANSDLFSGVLKGVRNNLVPNNASGLRLDRLDSLPAIVTVDTSGFLATVTVEV